MILALLGVGVMGQALARSIGRTPLLASGMIRLFDTDTAKAEEFAAATGAQCCLSAAETADGADVVLLAVKPAIVGTAIRPLAEVLTEKTILVSIAAGVPLSLLRSLAGSRPAIARAMPNTPARVGKGVTAVCFDQASPGQRRLVLSLFESCGLVFEIKEELMDAATGLSGSGPAYVFLMIEAMADAGVLLGLPRDISVKMAAMTLEGAASLVLESGLHPAQLKDQVTTPGGTTIEALVSLEEEGLRAALIHAVSAAADKSRRLREQSGANG
jgi:pyrroline-5-carboxylate reductase